MSIDLIKDMLPATLGQLLTLLLLFVALLVPVVGLQLGIKHVNSGWLFKSSSLKLPLDLIGKGV